MISLRGMTWDHERGIAPLIYASSVFHQKYEHVRMEWDARSLADFENYPLEQLADRYDFIMIDHPHLGSATAQKLLTPLDGFLPASFLTEQASNSVGPSHQSYLWEGRQWALAVDAAAQVSVLRADLLESVGFNPPRSWEDVHALTLALPPDVYIGIPLVPVHAYSSYFTLTSQLGGEPFWSNESAIPQAVGVEAIKLLREIVKRAHPESVHSDPIAMYERMTTTDQIAYVPLMYGYSNYSRPGFRPKTVACTNIPSSTGKPEGSMIGGVGLAISAHCEHPDLAAEFAMMTANGLYQRTEYFTSGGQPGHRTAWSDRAVNERAGDFFANTLQTLDLGTVRPRFEGYIAFQEKAGQLIRQSIMDNSLDPLEVVVRLNDRLHEFRR